MCSFDNEMSSGSLDIVRIDSSLSVCSLIRRCNRSNTLFTFAIYPSNCKNISLKSLLSLSFSSAVNFISELLLNAFSIRSIMRLIAFSLNLFNVLSDGFGCPKKRYFLLNSENNSIKSIKFKAKFLYRTA